MIERSFNIDDIGEVVLVQRRNSSRISVRINSKGQVRVNYPMYVKQKEAIQFARDNADWVKKQLKKLEGSRKVYKVGYKEQIGPFTLRISNWNQKEIKAVKSQDGYTIFFPFNQDESEGFCQEFIFKIISELCRAVAKSTLPARVHELAREHKFEYRRVFIKNLKSRWGSCSSALNINLNLQLVRLPAHLIDYVILHELVHTVHLNHGNGFKGALNNVTKGKSKELENELKSYKIE